MLRLPAIRSSGYPSTGRGLSQRKHRRRDRRSGDYMKKYFVMLLTLATTVTSNAQRPLGTFTLGTSVVGPAGYTTNNFKITNCPGTIDLAGQGNGQIAVKMPIGTPLGYIVLFSGHGARSLSRHASLDRQNLWRTSGYFWRSAGYSQPDALIKTQWSFLVKNKSKGV